MDTEKKRGPSITLTAREYRDLNVVGGASRLDVGADPSTLGRHISISSGGIDEMIVLREDGHEREELFVRALLDFMGRLSAPERLFVGVTYMFGGELPSALGNLRADLGIDSNAIRRIRELAGQTFLVNVYPDPSENSIYWYEEANEL